VLQYLGLKSPILHPERLNPLCSGDQVLRNGPRLSSTLSVITDKHFRDGKQTLILAKVFEPSSQVPYNVIKSRLRLCAKRNQMSVGAFNSRQE